VMQVDVWHRLSLDRASSWQKLIMPQNHQNSSCEIRSRRRSVPLLRSSSDLPTDEQLELVDIDSSPVAVHGHRFISANLSQPTWCDKCGDFIWGVYKQCLICTSMLTLILSFLNVVFLLLFFSQSLVELPSNVMLRSGCLGHIDITLVLLLFVACHLKNWHRHIARGAAVPPKVGNFYAVGNFLNVSVQKSTRMYVPITEFIKIIYVP